MRNDQPNKTTANLGPLGAVAGELWRKACEFDGVRPDDPRGGFSPENQYAVAYHLLALRLTAAPSANEPTL